jgi:magnesium chelatase family protein
MRRITVSLAPADLKKSGPSYDLPIAVGILMSSGQLPENVNGALLLGELALDGALRSTRGILPMVAVGRQRGYDKVFVPFPNAQEASLVDGMSVLPAPGLEEVIAHIRADEQIDPYSDYEELDDQPSDDGRTPNLADVRGQEHAKRALEVAAVGGHNLLMSGPPGSGKTLLARCLPSIIPPMTPEQSLEVTKIYSIAGLLPEGSPLITKRPFRSPHYTISNAGLVGGGQTPRPGEITLSHRGV